MVVIKDMIAINRGLVQEIYNQFSVPGVHDKYIPLLFNTSNYGYYKNQVGNLQRGICPFCTIDEDVNQILDFEDDSWLVIQNTIANRPGQAIQIVVPLIRHIEREAELTDKEVIGWRDLKARLTEQYGIEGSAEAVREGDPFFNAKSVLHYHKNFHVPTGINELKVTFGKDLKKISAKLEQLKVFEIMRKMEADEGISEPWRRLPLKQVKLVIDDLEAPPTLTKKEKPVQPAWWERKKMMIAEMRNPTMRADYI